MIYSRKLFHPRRSIDDFLAENLPNCILYECLRKTTLLSDETILTAFNEAYQTCIDVLAEPEQQSSLSDNLGSYALNAPQSSLLRLCFTYYLLSFHKEAPNLTHYLTNLKKLLEARLPEVFTLVMSTTSSVAPLFPDSVTFNDNDCEPLCDRSRDCVKVASLIKKAKELSKSDADIFLKSLQTVFAEEDGDWKELIRIAIKQNNARVERASLSSPYRIGDRHITDFVKIMRACCELRIFEEDNGLYIRNFEKFVVAFGRFFNTDVKNPSNLLSDAKTKSFLKVFDRLKAAAEHVLTKGDSLDEQKQKDTIHYRPRTDETELF